MDIVINGNSHKDAQRAQESVRLLYLFVAKEPWSWTS